YRRMCMRMSGYTAVIMAAMAAEDSAASAAEGFRSTSLSFRSFFRFLIISNGMASWEESCDSKAYVDDSFLTLDVLFAVLTILPPNWMIFLKKVPKAVHRKASDSFFICRSLRT